MCASYSSVDHIAGLNNFVEPCNIVFNIPTPGIDRAIDKLKSSLRIVVSPKEDNVTTRAREMRIKRVRISDEAMEIAVSI